MMKRSEENEICFSDISVTYDNQTFFTNWYHKLDLQKISNQFLCYRVCLLADEQFLNHNLGIIIINLLNNNNKLTCIC